jgi:hypothetical protein
MNTEVERITVEFLMICDGAHSVGGKLYILGGAWNHMQIAAPPPARPTPFSLALGVLVPWHLTNRRYNLRVELCDSDGVVIEAMDFGEAEVGRPPGLRKGAVQRLPIAIAGVAPEFPKSGTYVFQALIDDEKLAHTVVEVVLQDRVTAE